MTEKILKMLGVKQRKPDLKKWLEFVDGIHHPKENIKIAMVGKYVKHGSAIHSDVYLSVVEAVRHAAARLKIKIEIVPYSSEEFEINGKFPDDISGIIVPQGWGSRGVEGKIKAVQYARENKIPYLGLCFGMQMAVIEFARNVCKLKGANSEEADPKTKYPVIHIMEDQKKYLEKMQYGGTIRLGSWPAKIDKKSKLYELYRIDPGLRRDDIVYERHRHRYEFNNKYKKVLEKYGLKIAATSPDGKLVEAIEIPDHPFFIGTQYHPELQSRPLTPHPLFIGFLEACVKNHESKTKKI